MNRYPWLTRCFYSFILSYFSGYQLAAQTDPSLIWAKGFGNEYLGGGTNSVSNIKIDGSGNRYMTGYFTGTADFDLGVGVANLTGAGGNDIFLAKYDASGNYLWAKSMGGTDVDQGTSLVLDGSGNVLLTGYFSGTVDFDPSAGTVILTSAGGQDFFLAKYDASGNYVWAKRMGGTGQDQGYSLALDGSGNVLLAGFFSGTADFDPGDNTATLTSAGNEDIFLAKYDVSGNYVWAKRMGGTDQDVGTSIALDGNGNVLLTGYFSITADFDPGAGTVNLTSAGSNDIFFAKYDASGNYVWAKRIGGTSGDRPVSLVLDGSDNVLLTGWFDFTADFDPGVSTANLTSAGQSDIFLAKYDASGNYVWAKSMGSTSGDQGNALAVDGSGNVLLTGAFQGTADFDPGSGVANLTSVGSSDIFLSQYDVSGNYVWAKSMGGTGTDHGASLALDGSGNAYLAGTFINTVDFDPGVGTSNRNSGFNTTNGFVAGYTSANGTYVSVGVLNSTSPTNVVSQSVTRDGIGNVYVTGNFRGTVDFDPGAGTANLTSAGDQDIFLAKYDASGNYIWAIGMGGTGNGGNGGNALVLDGNNVLLTGYFTGTADFDPGVSTANLTSAGSTDIFFAKYDASGNYVWATSIGGTDSDKGNSLVLDGNNVLLTGYFSGTADFDPSAGTANLTSAGATDIFLAKYNASGNYVWAIGMGGTGFMGDGGASLALDGSGNVLLTGFFDGTADFDPSAGTANLTSASAFGSNIFLAKYDALGNYVWAIGMGGTDFFTPDRGASLALDGSGNVLLTGVFTGTADFDPSAGTANLTSAGDTDIFLAKYDASGNYVWAKSMGGTGQDVGTSIALDGSGNVLLTGYFSSTADFDPSAGTANLTSASAFGSNIFLAKYDASGIYVWAKSMGGTDFFTPDRGASLALDGSGNVLLTGVFTGTADFDPSAGTVNLTSMSGGQNGFIAVYSGPCINPTSGGTIAAPQTGASGFDPAAFTSSAAASGHSGTLEYQWQSSTTSSSAVFNDIVSSNSATYDAGSLTQTTWYKRLARVSCQADWTGAAESNVIEVTVHSSFTWNGSVSTDWSTAANWTPTYVPTSTSQVNIPSGTTHTPAIPATATIAELTVQLGSTLALASGTLTLTGNLINNGTITSTSGKLSMAGSSAQTISGTGTIASLEVNNSAGVTITSGVGNMLSVTSTLTPTLGTLTTNGNLTLKSTVSGTARVAQIPALGAFITGNVTVERYIPAARKWRMLTVPLKDGSGGTTNSVFYNWQNNGTVNGNTGVEIWGPGGSSTPSSGNGLQVGPNHSMRSYSGGWSDVQVSKAAALFNSETNNAYTLFAAGPFKNGGSTIALAEPAVATTLSATGVLITGTHTKTLSANPAAGQYFLVGNPYASPLDPTLITGDNLTNTFYMWDASALSANRGLGIYVGFDRTGNIYSTVTGSTGFNNAPLTHIQSGQAFFVKANAAGVNTNITFEEADKSSTAGGGMFGPQQVAGDMGMLRMTLQQDVSGMMENADGAVAFFYANGKAEVDRMDGSKLMNSSENIFFRRGSSNLMFEHRPTISSKDTLFVRMSNMKQSAYRLALEGTNLSGDKTGALLIDKYAKKETPLDLAGVQGYDFSVTSDSASTGDRFLVVFSGAAAPVVVTPDTDADAVGLKLYPNPVRNDLQVAVNGSMTGPFTIQVISGSGEPVWMRSGIASGTKRVAINTSGMVSGVYHLVLTDGQGGRMVKKFVKE